MKNKAKSFQKYFSILLIFFGTFSFGQKKFTLVLDAGHGGQDMGAMRRYASVGDVVEKNIVLNIVLEVGRRLEKHKDIKIIYTRKDDVFLPLSERTRIANRSKADLFVSIHANSSTRTGAYGTETFVQGPNQNKENLEVAKAENDVIFLDEQDRETFASYDPNSPESLIALKIQQSKYLEKSLILGGLVEENFVNKNHRFSRGVKQQNLHVLRLNAMPSVLIEVGFVSNMDEAEYINSQQGQMALSESIYDAIVNYKKRVDRKSGNRSVAEKPQKPTEKPLRNEFKVFLMSTSVRYAPNAPELRGLSDIFILKEGQEYRYYYGNSNMLSVVNANLKTARDAGFANASSVGFVPSQKLSMGYYTLEVAVTSERLSSQSYLLQTLKDVERTKENGVFYYTYGNFETLEQALKVQKEIEKRGILNSVIQKKYK